MRRIPEPQISIAIHRDDAPLFGQASDYEAVDKQRVDESLCNNFPPRNPPGYLVPVSASMVKRRGPPSQGWRAFLHNHAPDIAAMDLFVVPTIGFDLLYAFVIVRLDRRVLVWINVTANPTAEWVARQITEAFPWDEAPHYLIRDRDRIYGSVVIRRLRAIGVRDKPTAPASPWQNGFAERLIGPIRRECVDHIIVLGEAHLRRILKSYADYYNGVRTHRSLNKDAPVSRPVQRTGAISSRAILGGLHHHYARV
jgi:transposase InsO family protein